MANRSSEPGKRRTRQHIIEDLSIHHVEGFILRRGYTVQRVTSDYGYDLIMWTFDDEGYAERGVVYFQVKASEALLAVGDDYVFDVDLRDYNLWIHEKMPVILAGAVRRDETRGVLAPNPTVLSGRSRPSAAKGCENDSRAGAEIASDGSHNGRHVSGIQARSARRMRDR